MDEEIPWLNRKMGMDTSASTSPAGQKVPTTRPDEDLIASLQSDLSLEMDGVDMYQALADRERIPERKRIFEALSAIERKHTEQWAKRLQQLGAEVPTSHSG